MRTGSSDIQFPGHRGRIRPDARPRKARKSRNYRFDLEGLESRTLLATIPAATPLGSPSYLSPISPVTTTEGGNANSPTVAIDPYNSAKMVAVWSIDISNLAGPPHTTSLVQAAYSDNSGTNWTSLAGVMDPILDPTTIDSNPPTAYTQVTDPSVAFDGSGNVYVLAMQTSGAADGALTLSKFDFSSGSPTSEFEDNIVYQWVPASDAAISPTLAVDNSLPNPPAGVPADPYAGNVYIAWASTDHPPAAIPSPFNAPPYFNPNRAEVVVSSDGGNSFSGIVTTNIAGNNGPEQDSHPQLVINQNDSGQVTVAWEDFGTGSTATPYKYTNLASSIVAPGDSYQAVGTTGIINPGIMGTPADTPVTTDYFASVDITDPTQLAAIDNLTVTLDIVHAADQNLQIVLVAPKQTNGTTPSIILVNNQTNAAGTADTGVGITGANIGIFGESTTNPGIDVGTVFDDNATRNIFDPNTTGTNANGAPYIGHFQAEDGSLDSFVRSLSTRNGTWTLEITDFRTETNPGNVREFDLQLTANMNAPTREATIANFFGFGGLVVGGSLSNNFPTSSAATPNGIGPGLALAIDNTVGPDSPYQGRIYATFVGYYDVKVDGIQNPNDNTDIFLVYSDNGGQKWSTPVEVNDDSSDTDGYTESTESPTGSDEYTGREQFLPEIAVDQSTGTVVLSWRDGRDDAARARVATYITASIDGGNTFNTQVYANPSQTAVNAITDQTEILGPLADNESSGNPQRNSTFGFGNQMGLAVADGHVIPVWASNFFGLPGPGPTGFYNATTNSVNAYGEYIYVQPMAIAAGPRVINSTMGPIPLAEAASQTVSITVDFDRPVDPSTFTIADVLVYYNGTTTVDSFVPLTVLGVTPVASSGSGPNNSFGYTQFTVTFDPLPPGTPQPTAASPYNYTGTYSYMILPDDLSGTAISSPIWSFVKGVLRKNDPDDQNANGTVDQNPLTTPFKGLTPGDVYAVPMPQPSMPITFGPDPLSILQPPFNQSTLPLIVPGTQVLATQVTGTSGTAGTGTDDLLVDDTTSTLSVTFDRPVQVSTFTPSQVLQIMGPAGVITGPQNFPNDSVDQQIPAATSSTTPGTLPSTITIPSSSGTFTVQDLTLALNISDSNDASLSAVLIAPDGTQVALFSNVSGANFTDTVFDDSAKTSIAAGTAPFTGSYQPIGLSEVPVMPGLSSLIGKVADGTWTLQITNTSRTTAGVLVNWSLNIAPQIKVTAVAPTMVNGYLAATEFQIGFPLQMDSGTYTVQLSSGILDTFNQGLDTTQIAGLAVLRDQDQNGPTTTVNYNSTDLPQSIPAPSGGNPGQVTSTITVPDSFLVQGDTTTAGISGLRVQINLTYPTDPDLTATLYHYDQNGDLLGSVILFGGAFPVGSGTNTANFDNTVFDDNAGTPIQSGSAPFFATFNPQMPLSAFQNLNAQGTWQLVIQNSATGSGSAGTFNSWSLSFQKLLPTTGLGEPGSDNVTASFRIFTLGQTDAQSSEAWTAVGPAAITGASGQIGAIAVDPSDPSGNTVYVGGASGGIWKTTDFLTTSPNGPTYVPLTNFDATNSVNIGGITVFGRNHDPNQSIIIAATGDGNTENTGPGVVVSPGVGFLISMNGGQTWNLYDSTDNVDANGNILPIDSADRNREFVGTTAFQVVVDPQLTPQGQVIIYAALSGTNGGIWRSENTGQTWQLMLAGNATDVVLDPFSSTIINPTVGGSGNLQVVYAGFAAPTGTGAAAGVYLSPNQGQVWNLMTGTVGNPLIVNEYNLKNVNPNTAPSPNGSGGRIVLAVPSPLPTDTVPENELYEGWLYAAVSTPTGGFDGLFVTKDFGQNWTQVGIKTLPPLGPYQQAVPTNDITQPQYPITLLNQGNESLSLVVDPTNPNIAYLGGFGGDTFVSDTGLIRVDITNVWDAHSLIAYDTFAKDGGELELATQGAAPINLLSNGPPVWYQPIGGGFFTFNETSFEDFIRNPYDPFVADATLYVFNYASFTNNGAGATWTPYDIPMGALTTSGFIGTGYHVALAEIDPVTGLPRLIFGNNQGVWSDLDDNGTPVTQIGASDQLPGVNRNGNLQLTQFYNGAAQPGYAEAAAADALFYGAAADNGEPSSDPNILTNGDLQWNVPTYQIGIRGAKLSSSQISVNLNNRGVAVSQQAVGQPSSTNVYSYWFPEDGGEYTNFFMTNGVGQTFGLLQQSNGLPTPDPQWPEGLPNVPTGGNNFAVNPIDGNEMVISSVTGNIFETSNGGGTWFDIGAPSVFGSPGNFTVALAYGAPDPGAPNGIGNLGNFIYVGTSSGQIWATQVGGGTTTTGGVTTNNWILVGSTTNGLDGSQIEAIVTDPTRGSHEAYVVTQKGVYVIGNSIPSTSNPTPTWTNITGNLFKLPYTLNGQNYNPTTDASGKPYDLAQTLTDIVANWEYTIPNSSGGYFPLLYVSANSGVYMSINDGQSWTLFPDTTFGALTEGGNLPHLDVTSILPSIGAIDPNTGMPNLAGPYDPNAPTSSEATADPDVLLATTYGQGAFAINLAPMVFPATTEVDPGDVSGTAADGTPIVQTATPLIDGLSEITGFGNATRITIVDETPGDSTFGQIIGGFNPANLAGTNNSTNWTSSVGKFSIPINSGVFTANGLKTVEIYATDDAASVGNKVTLQFTLDVPNIAPPSPPVPPTLQLASYDVTGPVQFINGLTLTGSIQLSETSSLTVTLTAPNGVVETVYQNAAASGTVNFSNPAPDFFDGGPVIGTYTLVIQDATTGSTGTLADWSVTVGETTLNTSTPLPLATGTTTSAQTFGGYTNFATPNLVGVTSPDTTVELLQANGNPFNPPVTTTSDSFGDFALTFPNATDASGTFTVEAVATNSLGSTYSPPVTFTIQVGQPPAPINFRLDSDDDTGIKGDNITDDRTPNYLGTATPGATIELFLVGNSTVWDTVTADTSGNFSVRLPNTLSNGQVSLYVQAIDLAGNLSNPSNTLTVTIASVVSDYNGDSYSDAALWSPDTTTNQAQWLVKPTTETPPITFTGTLTSGSASVTDLSSTMGLIVGDTVTGIGIPSGTTILTIDSSAATMTLSANATVSGPQSLAVPVAFWFTSGTTLGPANVVPFQGDFDGDGLTDLAYYNLSTATWYLQDSSQGPISAANPPQSFPLGTPNSSIPVAAHFDANPPGQAADVNAPDEVGVFTINASGQGVWTILTSKSSTYSVMFGQTGDIPVPGDYDGVGYDEIAVYRPSTGQFLVDEPNGSTETITIPGIGVGTPDLSSLVPVPGGYDNANYFAAGQAQRDDAAVYDPNTGAYTILGLNGVVYTVSSGFQAGDIPVPADYAGNGTAQPTVFRPSTGQFLAVGGTVIATFGQSSGDIPLAAPLSYRLPADPSSTGTGSTGTGTGGSTGTGSTGTGSTGTGTGGSTGTGSGGTVSTGTGSGGTGTGSSSGTTSNQPPAQSPTSGSSSTGSHKVHHKKAVSHPKPKPSHAKKPANHVQKKATPHAKPKPKVQVHVVSHPAHKVVEVSTSSISAQKHAHVVDLALQDLHVNLLRKKSQG
jgi:large repetitive protein